MVFLLAWLVLRVFLAPLKPPLQKNSILIIYHLKWILDHVANDDLLRKAQRKPIIENKYNFVSSTWPIPVNPFYQQLNWLWKSLNILENSVEKTSLTLTIGRLSYNFYTSWNPQWSWQQSQFQLPCGICRWEIEVNFGVSLKQRAFETIHFPKEVLKLCCFLSSISKSMDCGYICAEQTHW